MKALASNAGKRKCAVVAMEAARRRLRPAAPLARARLKPRLLLSMTALIAAAATIAGVALGISYGARGDYDLAFLAPLWLLGPGLVPLLVVLLGRREEHRAPAPPAVLRLTRRSRRIR